MALKPARIWVSGKSPHSRNAAQNLGPKPYLSYLSLRVPGWELRSLGDASQEAITCVQDQKARSPDSGSSDMADRRRRKIHHFHKDMNHFPKPLSSTGLPSSGGSQLRIAYKGIPGDYSEIAALKVYPECCTFACDEYEDVFKAVESWFVHKAVLPIESSVAGSMHQNYDLLLRHKLHITGEVQLPINNCLLALPGVRKDELKRVVSHPQALLNCEKTLRKLGLDRLNAADTAAAAAQIVADLRERDLGAIASSQAAEIYGLEILAHKFQDYDVNITRFLILERDPVLPTTGRPHKTSIVFSLEKGAGSLFAALAAFALRDISLLKIESRPRVTSPILVIDKSEGIYFDYLFYVDVEASLADRRMQNAMFSLQDFSTSLHVLGSYPV